MDAASLRFSAAARLLSVEARRHGLTVPGFRSPPRLAGADRTIRRTGEGSAMVAVRLRGRPPEVVLADMIEGIVRANGLEGSRAERCRQQLAAAVGLQASRAA